MRSLVLARAPLAVTLAIVAFFVVVATLGIDETPHGRSDAAHLGFGYPFHFVHSELLVAGLNEREIRASGPWPFNPWENPLQGSLGAFLADWTIVFAVLLAIGLVLARRAPSLAPTHPGRRSR